MGRHWARRRAGAPVESPVSVVPPVVTDLDLHETPGFGSNLEVTWTSDRDPDTWRVTIYRVSGGAIVLGPVTVAGGARSWYSDALCPFPGEAFIASLQAQQGGVDVTDDSSPEFTCSTD